MSRSVAVVRLLEFIISLRLDNSIQVLVYYAHFLLRAEFFQNFCEIGRVIFVIHLSGHLKYDELINAAMNLFASFNL